MWCAHEVNEGIGWRDRCQPAARVKGVPGHALGAKRDHRFRAQTDEGAHVMAPIDQRLDQRAAEVPGAAGHKDPARHLNRSSNAFRALVGAVDFVSRSTVVFGSNSAHVFLTSFADIRTRIGR